MIQNILINMQITTPFLRKYKDHIQLQGPSSLIMYEINGRLLFFFRDIHIEPKQICNNICNTDKEKCVWVSDFLRELFSISPMCIDYRNIQQLIQLNQQINKNISFGKPCQKHLQYFHQLHQHTCIKFGWALANHML